MFSVLEFRGVGVVLRGKHPLPSVYRVKKVSFLKDTSSFSFSLLPNSGASNLGKIYAKFSLEVVTSLSVLDHWVH